MRRICDQICPKKSNNDTFPIKYVLRIELAPPVLEFTDLRRVHDSILAIRPIKAPLMRLRIVCAEREPLDVTGRAIHLDRVEFCAAIPNLVADARALKFGPSRGTG